MVGLILVRELEERLGLGDPIEHDLLDPRQDNNAQFNLAMRGLTLCGC